MLLALVCTGAVAGAVAGDALSGAVAGAVAGDALSGAASVDDPGRASVL